MYRVRRLGGCGILPLACGEMQQNLERRAGRQLLHCAQEIMLGIRIQIPLQKRRRVQRVEKLDDVAEVHFDEENILFATIGRGMHGQDSQVWARPYCGRLRG